MHTALKDLALEHLWVVYPGTENYPLGDRLSVLPITALPALATRLHSAEFRA